MKKKDVKKDLKDQSALDQWTFKETFQNLRSFSFSLAQKIFDFNQRSVFKLLSFFFFLFLSLSSFFVVLKASVRKDLKQGVSAYFEKPYRKILSKAGGFLFFDNRYFNIFKVQTHKGLFIEIYKAYDSRTKSSLLFDRILLSNPYDGYIHVQHEYRKRKFIQASGFLVADIDKDKMMEIIVPSFGQYFTAYIDVYKYNQESRKFERHFL